MLSRPSDNPIRVLMVDDDEDDFVFTRDLCAELDYGIALDWVSTYDAALAALAEARHDVCLLDYQLGAHTGLDLLRLAVAGGVSVPIIFVSGQANREVDVEAMQAGAADFLVKGSITAAGLERAIRYTLQQKRLEDELRRSRDELDLRVRQRTAALEAEIAERERVEAALRRADQHKNEFLAMLGHELRNPLSVISSGLSLLDSRLSEDDRRWTLTTMRRQVSQFTRLLDDLLDVSRIINGKISLRPERVTLAAVIKDALAVVNSIVGERGDAIRIEAPPTDVHLWADRARLEQILVNLLVNAVKYSDPGTPILLRAQMETNQVELSVIDHGLGMTPEMQRRVFDLFAQADNSLDRSRGGLGIGLTLVRRLVELHQGAISVFSEGIGKGSEFTVRLPTSSPKLAEQSAAADPADKGASSRPLRILVVDDNQDLAAGLALQLARAEHLVWTAHDGDAALEIARREKPEIMLVDIGLPKIDGYEVATRLRQQPEFSDTLLVAVSGYGQTEDYVRSKQSGFDRHFVKPVKFSEIVQLLADYAASRPGSSRSIAPASVDPGALDSRSAAIDEEASAIAQSASSDERRTALVVDDRQDSLLVTAALMRQLGWRVSTASSAAEAIAKAREGRPMVVLSDLKLEGELDGLAIARELRDEESLKNTLLVAYSGYDAEEHRLAARNAGFHLFLTKPVDMQKLEAALDAAMAMAR